MSGKAVSHHARGSACLGCGRTARAKRQGQLQQWRRQCQPLAAHAARLDRGHALDWVGQWRCLHCRASGPKLAQTPCLTLTTASRRVVGGRATGPPGARVNRSEGQGQKSLRRWFGASWDTQERCAQVRTMSTNRDEDKGEQGGAMPIPPEAAPCTRKAKRCAPGYASVFPRKRARPTEGGDRGSVRPRVSVLALLGGEVRQELRPPAGLSSCGPHR